MDEAFRVAKSAPRVEEPESIEPHVSRKQSAFARARRAHLRKYVVAVTSLCALVLASGLARMFIDGLTP